MSTSGASRSATAPGALQEFFRSGFYYSVPAMVALTTATKTDSDLWAVPLFVPRAVTVDRITAEITTAGTVGSVLRLGLYADDGNGYPAARLLDAGTLDGTQAPGSYEIVVAQAVPAGLLWVAYAQQGAPATPTTVRSINGPPLPASYVSSSTASNPVSRGAWQAVGGAAGAFPTPYPAGAVTTANSGPRLTVRVS